MNNSQPVSSKGPIFAFIGILAVAIALAVVFIILPKMKKDDPKVAENEKENTEQTDPNGTNNPAAAGGGVTDGGNTTNPGTTTQNPGLQTTGTGAPGTPSPYLTDSVLVADIVGKLNKGDVAGFIEIAGKDAASDVTVVRLQNLFVGRKYMVDPKTPSVEIGPVGDAGKSWEINLLPPAENLGLGPQKLKLDVVKDAKLGWSVTQIEAPDIEAIAAAANTTTSPNPAAPVAPAPAPAGAEAKLTPMQTAKAFLDAVVARDFATAKKHVDPAVLTDERLAALFIVVEEGKYRPHPEKPLIPTVTNDKASWMIVKLVSDAKESEFGLEMARADANANWAIARLNFDQMMQTVAASSGAGGVAYTEIRTDLKGGESLVLFFAFDDAAINQRVNKQLQIIADILKGNPDRKLNINGHADAKGEEDYNAQLSDKRAAEVRKTLLAMGVPESQVVTKAFGESAPKAPNFNPDGTDNTSGQAQNRRAEVYLDF